MRVVSVIALAAASFLLSCQEPPPEPIPAVEYLKSIKATATATPKIVIATPVASPSASATPESSELPSATPDVLPPIVFENNQFSGQKQKIYQDLLAYLKIYDKYMRNPKLNRTELNMYTTGEGAETIRKAVDMTEAEKWKRGGSVAYRDFEIADPIAENGVTFVEASYCMDLKNIKIINLETNEQITSITPRKAIAERVVMSLMPNGDWIMSWIDNNEVDSC
ncbi:MAG: hypothetical protein CR979_00865 [Propionibacterium sp.]|nr:MAG: hypothetical protein CR979_00865 [Propionibacterium sp.]